MMAVDLPKVSTESSYAVPQDLQGAVDLGDAAVDVTRHMRLSVHSPHRFAARPQDGCPFYGKKPLGHRPSILGAATWSRSILRQ